MSVLAFKYSMFTTISVLKYSVFICFMLVSALKKFHFTIRI